MTFDPLHPRSLPICPTISSIRLVQKCRRAEQIYHVSGWPSLALGHGLGGHAITPGETCRIRSPIRPMVFRHSTSSSTLRMAHREPRQMEILQRSQPLQTSQGRLSQGQGPACRKTSDVNTRTVQAVIEMAASIICRTDINSPRSRATALGRKHLK